MQERRKHKRVAIDWAGTLVPPRRGSATEPIPVQLHDLSGGGVALSCSRSLVPGDRFRLDVLLPDGPTRLPVMTIISAVPDGSGVHARGRFESSSVALRDIVQRLEKEAALAVAR